MGLFEDAEKLAKKKNIPIEEALKEISVTAQAEQARRFKKPGNEAWGFKGNTAGEQRLVDEETSGKVK